MHSCGCGSAHKQVNKRADGTPAAAAVSRDDKQKSAERGEEIAPVGAESSDGGMRGGRGEMETEEKRQENECCGASSASQQQSCCLHNEGVCVCVCENH